MALLDTLRPHRGRATIHVAVALMAVLAVATPAATDGAHTPPPDDMADPTGPGGLGPGSDAQPPDPCPRPEGSAAFVYRNGDFRRLPPVRGADSTYHLGINDRRQTIGIYAEGGAELGADCAYPLEQIHGFIQDRWGRVTTIDVPGGDSEFPEGGINDRGPTHPNQPQVPPTQAR